MAIVKTTNAITKSIVIEGLKYRVKINRTTAMQQANNNRSNQPGTVAAATTGSSANFKNLDAAISGLDGQYDALPNKNPWITYSENIAGSWALCASCQPDAEAKKLYRQYNLNRRLLGLNDVTEPIDDTEFADCDPTQVFYVHASAPGTPYAIIYWTGGDADTYLVPSSGLGLGNPLYRLNAAENGTPVESGPAYTWVASWATRVIPPQPPPYNHSIQIQICQFKPSGAPGLPHIANLQVDYL